MKSVIEAAEKRARRYSVYPRVMVSLVNIDDIPIAALGVCGQRLGEDIIVFTSELRPYNSFERPNYRVEEPNDIDLATVTIGEVATYGFDAGYYYAAIGWKYGGIWAENWPRLLEKTYGIKSFREGSLSVSSFPGRGPLKLGSYDDFGLKGESKKQISFGKLSSDTLNAVQGVRVCVGGLQYRAFLTEISNRTEKDASERKALEED